MLHPNLVLSSEATSTNSSGVRTVDVNALIKRFADEEADGSKNIFAEGVLAGLGEVSVSECPICLDVMEAPMIIPECMHQWCVHLSSQSLGSILSSIFSVAKTALLHSLLPVKSEEKKVVAQRALAVLSRLIHIHLCSFC